MRFVFIGSQCLYFHFSAQFDLSESAESAFFIPPFIETIGELPIQSVFFLRYIRDYLQGLKKRYLCTTPSSKNRQSLYLINGNRQIESPQIAKISYTEVFI